MIQLLKCPRGHSWNSAETPGPACPICGGRGETTGAELLTEKRLIDELPPPPRRSGSGTSSAVNRPKIPGYEIEGVLGRGGMGVVYRARQLSLGRVVALKMILTGAHLNAEALARFRGEAQTLARVQHPSIVHIYDVLDVEGTPCIAMEFVDGGSLDEHLDGQPMAPRDAVTLVRTLARAVHAAHERKVIHRDLKPANILLAADGTPKITDFGLAKRIDEQSKHTKSGHILGTPHYMAPEQAEGTKGVGPATDVYALGAILYEALTGRPPFRGQSAAQVLKQVLFDEPASPSGVQPAVPARLDAICLRCLSKDPAKRYATAQALAEELDQFLSAPATPAIPVQSQKATKRLPWALAAVLLLAGVVGVAFLPGVRDWLRPSAAVVPSGSLKPHWDLLAKPAMEEGEAFDRIAFPTRTLGYMASRRALYKTEDGGKTWTKRPLDPPGRAYVLQFTDEKNGWLGTDQLRQTSDGGQTWNAVPLAGETMNSVAAFVIDANGWGLAGGTTRDGKLALFRRPNSGASWEKIETKGDLKPHAEWFVAALNITGSTTALAVVFQGVDGGGAALRTTDGGQSWSKILGSVEDLYAVAVNADSRGWLAGFRGALWHTADGGMSFHPVDANDAGDTPTCLAFDASGTLGVAPLWNNQVLLNRGDREWARSDVSLGYALPHAVVVDAECGYVLAANGQIARLTLRR